MCRRIACTGSPVLVEDLLHTPEEDSLVVQSLHDRSGGDPTDGDGFGLARYGGAGSPRQFRSTEPAWNDQELRENAARARSRLVFAHVRASATAGSRPDPR